MTTSKELSDLAPAHMERVAVSDLEKSPGTTTQNAEDVVENYEGRVVDLRTVMGLVALAFTYEACLFSFVLPAAILLTINQAVGPSEQITWLATAWALCTAVVQTIAGRLSDIFGRRNYFIIGNIFGLVGCCISCRGNSVNVLIVGSSFMGVGAGLQQLSFAAASEIIPKKHRGKALAFLSFVSIPGSTFGSVIAYAIVANLDWRWTYYLGVIVNALALVLVIVFYWPPGFLGLHPEGKTRLQQFKELDFVGLVLFGGGLTIFLVGLSFGGNPYPWRSAITLCPLVIGGFTVFVAFPLWEVYSSDKITKLCPPHLLANVRCVTIPLLVIFVSGMTLISLQVLWPQQVQMLFTTNPTTVGWYTVSYNASATAGTIVGGYAFNYLRRTRYQFIAVILLQTLFIGVMATVNQHTPARAIVLVALASYCIGSSQVMGILIVQLGANDRDIGVATGLLNSLRSTGGAIGIAIYSSLIHNRVSANLVPQIAGAVVQAGLPVSSIESFVVALTSGSQSGLATVIGITPEIIAAGVDASKTVFASAFKLVFCVSLAFGGLACIGSLFVSSVDNKLTNQVLVKLDKPHVVGHGKGEAMVLSKAD